MDIKTATRKLEAIQKLPTGSVKHGFLEGEPVTINPVTGNAFCIKSAWSPQPEQTKSCLFLKAIGAPVVPQGTDTEYPYITALVTWDSMLHLLVLAGKLELE